MRTTLWWKCAKELGEIAAAGDLLLAAGCPHDPVDWREARRHADQLHAMGFGRRTPMTEQEQAELHAKVAKLVADAKTFPVHPREI